MRPFLCSPRRARRSKSAEHPPTQILAAIAAVVAAAAVGGACDQSGPSGRDGEGAASPQGTPLAAEAPKLLAPLRARWSALDAIEGLNASVEPVDLGAQDDPITSVHLPGIASDPMRVVDAATGVGVAVSLEGAEDTPAHLEDSLAFYPRSLSGAHVLRKVLPHGAEDFVAFDEKPAKEEVRYEVETVGAAGMRVLPGLVEILDDHGAPRVRMSAPTYTDATGEHAASFSVQGCNADRDPAPAWSRPFARLDADTTCTLVVGFEGASYPMLLDPQWADSGFMTTDRTNHTATFLTSDFTILLVGGFDVNGTPLASAEIMCPSEICPPTSTFTPLTGTLAQARGDHTEALLPNGSVLLAGGRSNPTGPTGLATAEVCTLPNFTCSTVAMSTGRLFHSSTTLNSGKVLVAGGDSTSPSTAQVFDSGTNSFGAPLTMAAKRVGHAAELLTSTGQVFLVGGLGGIGAVSTAEFYDPNSNLFTAIAGSQLTSPRAFATATRLEDVAGTILITGGTNGSNVYYKTADVFVPNGMGGGSFQQQPVFMKVNRAFHRATRLKGTGKVLLTGGFDGTNILANTEVFDQSTTAFTLDSTMTRARAFHTATQLKSGQALVTGGGHNPNTNTTVLASAASTEILRRSNGEACAVGGECVSGFCAGNGAAKVCCDEECSNICSSCKIDAVNAVPGHCHTVQDLQPVKPICVEVGQVSIQTEIVCIAGEVANGVSTDCLAYACNEQAGECAKGDCMGKADVCSPTLGFCASAGCKLKQQLGKSCDANEQCLSGHCADGVCCNATCDGQCEACDAVDENNVTLGICEQVIGDVRTQTLKQGFPTGRDPCNGFGKAECSGKCGTQRTVCDYPELHCGNDVCTDGATASSVEVGKCTPDGNCTPSDVSCGDFKCDDPTKCVVECTSTSQCSPGHICKPDGTCASISEATCADDHTAVTAEGVPTDCGAYHCRENTCLTRCENIDDCISPKVCDAQGACVDPPPDPVPPDGCSTTSGDAPLGGAAGLSAVALALAMARRGRRAAKTGGVR